MRRPAGDPMRGPGRWVAAALLAAGLGLAGCTAEPTSAHGEAGAPANVEAIPGTEVSKVTLTEQAARRLGIQTVAVAAAPASQRARGPLTTVVPYAAVLYAPDGGTWVYAVREPLTYVREKVVVAAIGGTAGTDAILSVGPPVGTAIVLTGVIELWGTELGVGS
ncbi:MAG TPA: hypothetical protein VFR67_06245 [Pilimelia sp.]|nr:hypothetical protein [Pilimelia sp.]